MFYIVKQTYEYFNRAIGINQVRTYMNTGLIPLSFMGRKLVTTKKDLDEFIELTRKPNKHFINTKFIEQKALKLL